MAHYSSHMQLLSFIDCILNQQFTLFDHVQLLIILSMPPKRTQADTVTEGTARSGTSKPAAKHGRGGRARAACARARGCSSRSSRGRSRATSLLDFNKEIEQEVGSGDEDKIKEFSSRPASKPEENILNLDDGTSSVGTLEPINNNAYEDSEDHWKALLVCKSKRWTSATYEHFLEPVIYYNKRIGKWRMHFICKYNNEESVPRLFSDTSTSNLVWHVQTCKALVGS
ncbi:hypothetical protein CPB85DRAFT_1449456 [Mucidula mucida]|nr:hypothetical protein CPB85DRAFT_1449456 [Mucidula mucida]